VKLLNMHTDEEYTFMASDEAVISLQTCEWLEMPVYQTETCNMLPCKPEILITDRRVLWHKLA